MIDQVLAAWRVNNRINLLLTDHIDDEGMRCTLSSRRGRSVGRQFAHLHNNRIWHLTRRAKALATNAHLFATHDEPDRHTLASSLRDSAQRIEQFIRLASEGAPGVRTFKRGLIPCVAYFIAHESHHRGNILLTLKQSGHAVEKKVRDAIWDWDRL